MVVNVSILINVGENEMKNYVMNKFLTLFIKDEEGASGIEYALIAVMVAVVLAVLAPDIAAQVQVIFNQVKDGLTPAA